MRVVQENRSHEILCASTNPIFKFLEAHAPPQVQTLSINSQFTRGDSPNSSSEMLYRATPDRRRGYLAPRLAIWLLSSARAVLTYAAALLEDHSASWLEAGLSDALARVSYDALSPAFLSAVQSAAPRLLHESLDGGTYLFGKKNTWWVPLFDSSGARVPPRSELEAAIHVLYELDFGGARVCGSGGVSSRSGCTPIVGAEWWFQEQDPVTGSVGFHYDKDEAYASEHMTMRFPEVSTVTYLSAIGAPTIIFNQTTPDGNVEIPELPRLGFLVRPRPNKHLVFRGNLQHGVSADLAAPSSLTETDGAAPLGAKRWTLLVNFWRTKPMGPNCVEFDTARWRRLGLLRELARESWLVASTRPPVDWTTLELEAPRYVTRVKRVAIELPPTDLLYLDFPSREALSAALAAAEARALPQVVSDARAALAAAEADNLRLEWGVATSFGPISRLDLQHRSSTSNLFSDVRPKLFFVLSPRGSTLWVQALPRWLPALHRLYGERLRFVLADPSNSMDFLNHMGIKPEDAPMVVLHDTARNDAKRFLPRDKVGGASGGKAVRAFIDEYMSSISAPAPAEDKQEL